MLDRNEKKDIVHAGPAEVPAPAVVSPHEDVDVQMAKIDAETTTAVMNMLGTAIASGAQLFAGAQVESTKLQLEHARAEADAERPIRRLALMGGIAFAFTALGIVTALVLTGHGGALREAADFMAKLGAGGLVAIVLGHAAKKK